MTAYFMATLCCSNVYMAYCIITIQHKFNATMCCGVLLVHRLFIERHKGRVLCVFCLV